VTVYVQTLSEITARLSVVNSPAVTLLYVDISTV